MKTLLTILTIVLLSECDEYTIGGYEFDKEREFISVYDQDSTKHTYKHLDLGYDNWCLEHWQYETVSINGLHNKKTED